MYLLSLKLLNCPMVYRTRYIYKKKTLYYLEIGVKVTQNVAKYTLHHVTYAPAKFEVAKSNSFGGDEFTRKYI